MTTNQMTATVDITGTVPDALDAVPPHCTEVKVVFNGSDLGTVRMDTPYWRADVATLVGRAKMDAMAE